MVYLLQLDLAPYQTCPMENNVLCAEEWQVSSAPKIKMEMK